MASPGVTGGVRAGTLSFLETLKSSAALKVQNTLVRTAKTGNDLFTNNHQQTRTSSLEQLEQRTLLAAAIGLTSGTLWVTGAWDAPNTISLTVSGTDVVARLNSLSKTYARSSVGFIEVYGGSLNDKITIDPSLTAASKALKGYDGNDTILGGGGADSIWGGNGSDLIDARGGNDVMYGEAGNDTLYGGAGDDKLDGGTGTNKLDYSGSLSTPAPPPTGGGTPTNTDASTPTPVITATLKSIQAGHAIHVNALGSTLRAGSPITTNYEWDFGDPGSKYNTLVGYNAAHLYEQPGTYTVRLKVTNQAGKSATTSTSVTIAAAGRKVYYVSSSSGSDSNTGTSDRPLKTFAKAVSKLDDNVEIRFKRGESFSVPTCASVSFTNVVIGAYGSGNKPVLTWTGELPTDYYTQVFSLSSSNRVTVRDLAMRTTFGGSGKIKIRGIRLGGTNVGIVGNEFRDFDDAINGNAKPAAALVQDNTSPAALRGAFAWVTGTDLVYVGNVAFDSYNENMLRVAGDAERVLLAFNNMTNQDNGGSGDQKATYVVQNAKYVYMHRNISHDGWISIGPLGNSAGLSTKDARTLYPVVEGTKLYGERILIKHGAENVMLRNNVVQTDGGMAFEVEGYNSTYGRGVKNLNIINNTGVSTGEYGSFLRVQSGGASGITLVNNLYIADSMITGSYGSAAVYVEDNDLSSFSRIDHNVWPMPTIKDYAQGGINYIWPTWSDPAGYMTPSEWNAFGVVGTDYFVDTAHTGFTPSSSSIAATAGLRYAGVFTDVNGEARPLSGDWTVGADEV
jgi:PKD repeat protein